jgi:histidyl-tRNA synthetase
MSKDKKAIYKPKPISGFPEWLPEERLVEQKWLDHIRKVFESYGFTSLETPAVEELEVIAAKGEDADKEIYVIERLHKEEGDKEARLALHFDQTVPFARYTAQHFNNLTFPFKRYQIQKVWRGERPQAGRMREFYQCDIDVINVDNLPISFDAEMPAIMWEVLSSLPGMENEQIQIRVSNRKILLAYLEGIQCTNAIEITRIIDKLEKIGKDNVLKALSNLGLNDFYSNQLLSLANIKVQHSQDLKDAISRTLAHIDIADFCGSNSSDHYLQDLYVGIEELSTLLNSLSHLPEGAVVADLSIVRGLDYYTGTVYETVFVDDPGYGSICSGGRYDDLAGSYINKHLPGVGISIGFSRLFDRLRSAGKLDTARKSPTDILVVLPNEEQRSAAAETARTLRGKGYNVELYHAPQKIGKQIGYAEKKGISYVWFPPFDMDGGHEVKNMNTGEQAKADPTSWTKN